MVEVNVTNSLITGCFAVVVAIVTLYFKDYLINRLNEKHKSKVELMKMQLNEMSKLYRMLVYVEIYEDKLFEISSKIEILDGIDYCSLPAPIAFEINNLRKIHNFDEKKNTLTNIKCLIIKMTSNIQGY